MSSGVLSRSLGLRKHKPCLFGTDVDRAGEVEGGAVAQTEEGREGASVPRPALVEHGFWGQEDPDSKSSLSV